MATGTRDGRTVANVIADLRGEILAGSLPPGTPLRTEALARRLGTSRVPVREALHELVGQGLVELHERRGARVVDIDRSSTAELLDLISVRRALEPWVASEAAVHHSPEDLVRLRASLEAGVAAVDPRAAGAAHHALLLAILEASGSETSVAVGRPLVDRSAVVFRLLAPEVLPAGWDDHRACVDAIAACDRRRAAAAVRRHLDDIRRALAHHPFPWASDAP